MNKETQSTAQEMINDISSLLYNSHYVTTYTVGTDDYKNAAKEIVEYFAAHQFKQSPSDAQKGEWQLCPKCNGQGKISRPPWINGDATQWSGSQTSFVCDVCNGQKVIQRPILSSDAGQSSNVKEERL